MKKIFLFTQISILLTFIYLTLPLNTTFYVYAADMVNNQTIRVSPVILQLSLDPGSVNTYPIRVDNLTESPLPLKASIEGFDASDEDFGYKFIETTKSPLQEWVKLDREDTIIPAKGTQTFNATVSIPKEVPIGGYYTMIFFTPIVLTPNTPVNARVGVLALANIGISDDTQNKISIENFDFNHWLYQQNPIETTIRVKNISINYFSVKPTLTIKPLFGEIQEFSMEEKVILPGKIRRWQKEYNLDNLPIGIYLAKLAVSTGQGDQVVISKQFYVFPLNKTLIFLIPAMLFGYTIIYRQRVIKALNLLIKGK